MNTITKTSHTQKIREKYESNRQLIQKEIDLSDHDHFWFKTEVGCLFLERLYPRKTEYEEYLFKHQFSTDFWQWFGYVWAKWEADFIKYSLFARADVEDYKSDFEQLIHDPAVEHDFYNVYLKMMINEH